MIKTEEEKRWEETERRKTEVRWKKARKGRERMERGPSGVLRQCNEAGN